MAQEGSTFDFIQEPHAKAPSVNAAAAELLEGPASSKGPEQGTTKSATASLLEAGNSAIGFAAARADDSKVVERDRSSKSTKQTASEPDAAQQPRSNDGKQTGSALSKAELIKAGPELLQGVPAKDRAMVAYKPGSKVGWQTT